MSRDDSKLEITPLMPKSGSNSDMNSPTYGSTVVSIDHTETDNTDHTSNSDTKIDLAFENLVKAHFDTPYSKSKIAAIVATTILATAQYYAIGLGAGKTFTDYFDTIKDNQPFIYGIMGSVVFGNFFTSIFSTQATLDYFSPKTRALQEEAGVKKINFAKDLPAIFISATIAFVSFLLEYNNPDKNETGSIISYIAMPLSIPTTFYSAKLLIDQISQPLQKLNCNNNENTDQNNKIKIAAIESLTRLLNDPDALKKVIDAKNNDDLTLDKLFKIANESKKIAEKTPYQKGFDNTMKLAMLPMIAPYVLVASMDTYSMINKITQPHVGKEIYAELMAGASAFFVGVASMFGFGGLSLGAAEGIRPILQQLSCDIRAVLFFTTVILGSFSGGTAPVATNDIAPNQKAWSIYNLILCSVVNTIFSFKTIDTLIKQFTNDEEKNKLDEAKSLVQAFIDIIQRSTNAEFIDHLKKAMVKEAAQDRRVEREYDHSQNNATNASGQNSDSRENNTPTLFGMPSSHNSGSSNQNNNSDSDDESRYGLNINAQPSSLLEAGYTSYGTQP